MSSRIYERQFDEDDGQTLPTDPGCPECEGDTATDGGETACVECGLVIDEYRIDHRGRLYTGFDEEETVERTGPPLTEGRHDRGLSSEIGWKRDARGNTLTSRKRRQLARLRTRHRRGRLPPRCPRVRVRPLSGASRRPRARGVDPLFHVPTDSYAIINPHDVYTPLEAVVAEKTIDGRPLGDAIFGAIRQYRGGGEVHMDVLFDGLSVTLPGREEPIAVGFSSGYDFFGGHAVYVEGFAQDSYCANSIHALTDRRTVKHVGDVQSFETWWERLLGQLQIVADDLAAFITDAREITLDLREVPFDVETFYALLDFPDYLAERAASDARAEADDPFEIDMWTLHTGATHALTHFYTGKEGAALDRYVRVANDILFNPAGTLDRLTRTYRQQVSEATRDDGQTGLDDHAALAQVERVERDLRADIEQFETREAALRERFAQGD
ncbi:transcription initiation factor IIB family protein [Halarchaeum nitratireducens]|uniref:TFIIB-type domain-containing protein n=1 Tax=Halarchaeum nitratireducens TaxID=489913 RepID=A0A830GF70_9EURY|nr:hypothetical protein [Halarchaeum nitratireducens]GGN23565.1 hypothetical protein GCM10009021_26440 [Halarchaeum nitratireducens]